tara:strand:+ start:486 stop:623 length:138 start_codon:yes stop_codon:yes gene_type:complete
MKHIIHLVDKYEDVAEALKTFTTLTLITGAIIGLAPFLIWVQTGF